jgi:hypothetical protein
MLLMDGNLLLIISHALRTFDPLSLTIAENLFGPTLSRIFSIFSAMNCPV